MPTRDASITHEDFQGLLAEREAGTLTGGDAARLLDAMIEASRRIRGMMQICVEEKYKYGEGTIRHENWQGKADAYRGMWADFANRWYVKPPWEKDEAALIDARYREGTDDV